MPVSSGIDQSNWLAMFKDIGNDQDLRMMLQVKTVQNMHLQGTKTAAERDMLLWRDVLIAKYHHAVLNQCGADLGDTCIGYWLVQIETMDFGTERSVKRTDAEGIL